MIQYIFFITIDGIWELDWVTPSRSKQEVHRRLQETKEAKNHKVPPTQMFETFDWQILLSPVSMGSGLPTSSLLITKSGCHRDVDSGKPRPSYWRLYAHTYKVCIQTACIIPAYRLLFWYMQWHQASFCSAKQFICIILELIQSFILTFLFLCVALVC